MVAPPTLGSTTKSKEPFRVAVDSSRRMLRITFNGFWSLATVEALQAELARVRLELTARGTLDVLARMLIVILYEGVQPQDVAARLRQSLIRQPNEDRRIAMLVSGAQLQRMQVGRIVGGDRHRFFTSEAEATAWLFSGV